MMECSCESAGNLRKVCSSEGKIKHYARLDSLLNLVHAVHGDKCPIVIEADSHEGVRLVTEEGVK